MCKKEPLKSLVSLYVSSFMKMYLLKLAKWQQNLHVLFYIMLCIITGSSAKNRLIHISQHKMPQAQSWVRRGRWSGPADTHVLVRADQEAVVNVSLHQARLPYALLPQHHHLGVHTHGAHGDAVRRSRPTGRAGGAASGQRTAWWEDEMDDTDTGTHHERNEHWGPGAMCMHVESSCEAFVR